MNSLPERRQAVKGCEWRERVRLGQHRRRAEEVERCELVPVAPFRERFEFLQRRGQMTLTDLCLSMGWIIRMGEQAARRERRRPGYVKANTSHARHTLGVVGGKQYISYDQALKLCHALGMDPWEGGI